MIRRLSGPSLWLALGLFAGCGPREDRHLSEAPPFPPADSVEEPEAVIGLSVLTLTNPFFKEIGDSMTQEARRYGYAVTVVSGDYDVDRQATQVRGFIRQQVAAIVLTPCDSIGIGPALLEANAAGIPVFTADIACLAPGVRVVTHVATDNYGGGREAGLAMIEALGPAGGRIGILSYDEIESCLLRVKGFKEVIAEHNAANASGHIEIVANLSGGADWDKSLGATRILLDRHPEVTAIFAINDPSALGALAAIEQAGRQGQIKLIGFDGQPQGKKAIKDGLIHADAVQFPDKIGAETVRAVVRHLAGESVPPEILIPTALYRQADAEKDPALK